LRKRVKDVERLKEEGNTAFKGSRLQDAIARYTEALDVRPFPFTNTRTDPPS
jgi:DnaJ family protein C protein 7